MKIITTGSDFQIVRDAVLAGEQEGCAVGLCVDAGNGRFLVREWLLPTEGDYAERSGYAAQLTPSFVVKVAKLAASSSCTLVFLHSHPFDRMKPSFSPIDDEGEKHLSRFLAKKGVGGSHFAVVVSHGGTTARLLNSLNYVSLVEIGQEVKISGLPSEYPSVKFDRQIRAFGADGQRTLSSVKVAIVGLGGLGSALVQQLALLGVKTLGLFDPDTIEETNLNRLFLTSHDSIGEYKVSAIGKEIETTFPSVSVKSRQGDVCYTRVAKELTEYDFIFLCTDTHGSRAVVNQIAYQYLIPTIDTGTVIAGSEGSVRFVSGRVQALIPGSACLVCSSLLDYDQVRRDLMSEDERTADPYFLGEAVPQPAVASINSVVASLAATMFLAMLTGLPLRSRYQLYDAIKGSVRSVQANPDPSCLICSTARGVLARGPSVEIAGRNE